MSRPRLDARRSSLDALRSRLDAFRSRLDRNPVAGFVFVAFGWTWTWDVVYYSYGWWESFPVYLNTFPRQWGLPIGAVLVVWASDVPLREWLGRVLRLRVRPWVYAAAVLLPFVIGNSQPVLAGLGGGTVQYSPPAPLHLLFAFFLLNVFLFGGIEEFGWRGYLQPTLQERFSVLGAGLLVGMLWWAWHLPLFLGHPNFTPEPMFLVTYTAFVVGAATVLGALVNLTDGAVVPAVLLHAMINVGSLLAGSGGMLDGVVPISLVVGSGAWWLVTAVLVALYGRSMTPGATSSWLA